MKIQRNKKVFFGALIVTTILLYQTAIISHINAHNLRRPAEKNLQFVRKNELNFSIWQEVKERVLDRYIPLFGYKLVANDPNPIERDETATLKLSQNQKSSVDIEIKTKFHDYLYEDVLVESEGFFETPGELALYHFEIENPLKGFFMEISVFNDNSLINLAFDGGLYQLSYDGVLDEGFSQFTPESDNIIEFRQSKTTLSAIKFISCQELELLLRQHQEKSVTVYNTRYLAQNRVEVIDSSSQSLMLSIPQYQYGIVHEGYDFGLDYPEELSDDYWEPYSCIDIGIHRNLPSESQIKSDLQYYNKDYFVEGSGYIHDIMAYNMVTHGGPHWDVYEWRTWLFLKWQEYVGTIYPSEVEDLWYEFVLPYEGIYIYVYPTDTIIISDSCYGYSYGSSGDPTMAKAFVNYGATAFVGATITIPAASDSFMRVFWESLCQDDTTIATATTNLCNDYGNNWNLGDEWKILGNSSATLPN